MGNDSTRTLGREGLFYQPIIEADFETGSGQIVMGSPVLTTTTTHRSRTHPGGTAQLHNCPGQSSREGDSNVDM